MLEDQVKTTAKDFAFFKSEVTKWVEKLGLKNWEIICTHEKDEGNRASARYNISARIAFINIGTLYPKILYNKKELQKSAFHEVCELLLADLVTIAEQREYDDASLMCEKHRIIHTLENIIFDKE